MAALALWRNDARPLPVAALGVARAALEDGAEAVVIDIAGPAQFALSGPALWAVAEGRACGPRGWILRLSRRWRTPWTPNSREPGSG